MLRNQWSFPRWRNESRRLWANVFPAGEANFGQAMYRSLERSPQDTRDGFDSYSAQASLAWPRVNLARPLRRVVSRPFWIVSFEFVKVCGIRFSIWESFNGFYIWCYPISTVLVCLFPVGVRILWKKLSWKGSMAAKMASLASYLVYYHCIESEFEHRRPKFITWTRKWLLLASSVVLQTVIYKGLYGM